jgi:hypothetical protein
MDVDLISSAGEVVLDLVPDPASLTDKEGTLLIEVLHQFDIADALPVMARLGTSASRVIRSRLAVSWPGEAAAAYAQAVLREMRLDDVTVRVSSEDQLRSAALLPDLTNVLIEQVSGSLDALGKNDSLRTLMLRSVTLDDLAAVQRHPMLRSLILFESTIGDALHSVQHSGLEELALLGAGSDGLKIHRYVDAVRLLRRLRRLTIDQSYVADGELDLPSDSPIERLDLLSAAWMASVIDYVHRDTAWMSIVPAIKAQQWRRPTVSATCALPHLRELSVSGWPSPSELETIAGIPQLETLRVVVPDDDLRQLVRSNGIEYSYPEMTRGTIVALPSLKRLDVALLTAEKTTSRRRRGGSAGVAVVYPSGCDAPTLVSRLATSIPSDSEIEVVVNGLPILR